MTNRHPDTASGETCTLCGYTDGHNVETCPLVLEGKVKKMPGLSPEAVQRLSCLFSCLDLKDQMMRRRHDSSSADSMAPRKRDALG